MKNLITLIILVLVLILLFKSCGGGPAASDLHGLVTEDATCFVGVDAAAIAEFLKPHHKMADKYLPDIAPVVDEMFTKDFYKSMELLDPKMFTVVNGDGEPVIGLRMDDEIPFGTLLRGFAPLVEKFDLAEDIEITQPDEDENLFLAAEDDDALETVKENFGKKGAKVARKRLAGINYNKCLIYGWLDTKAAMGLVGSAAGFLPVDVDMAAEVCKAAGTLRFGVKANGKWKLNIVFIGSFEGKDKATEFADGLKKSVKQGIDELKGQTGKAEGIAKDAVKLGLSTLKGLKVKRSGTDVRIEVTLDLKGAWNLAKKLQKEGGAAAARGKARGKAGAVACMNSLKQCAIGLELYASDNKGFLPAADAVQDALKQENVGAAALRCPVCDEPFHYLGDSSINAEKLENRGKCILFYCGYEHDKGKLQACTVNSYLCSVDKQELEAAIKKRAPKALPIVNTGF